MSHDILVNIIVAFIKKAIFFVGFASIVLRACFKFDLMRIEFSEDHFYFFFD